MDRRRHFGIPLEALEAKGFPSGYSKRLCVSACTQKCPNLRRGFLKRRLTNIPRCHRLADGQLSSLYAPSPSFSSFGAASVMLCCSAPPAYLSSPLWPSVRYPSIGLVVNIMHIRTFCDHLNVLHIFGVPGGLVGYPRAC